ncbi:MAG: c-type cytochrome [Akkermansiaceae bacterium]|nr:c-type cytochrome [Akkermansiaceae bacterium]
MRLLLILLIFAGASVSAKEPPNAVDHAGIIQSWDRESLASGEKIYKSLCTNCHGADGVTPPLPTARAFGKGELNFGKDPYSMFKTLTYGNGMMGPQTWMTPKERYAVIHYIRERFMKPMRKDFVEVHDGYLEGLPTVNVVVKESDKKERDFGPALASQLGRDISSVLSVKLGDDTTICYNLHSMDQAGLWTGGFLNLLNTQHYRERGGGVAQPKGEMVKGLQRWEWAHGGTFDYSREDLLARGPIPKAWMDYRGHYVHEGKVVLSYSIDGREILEQPGKKKGYPAIEHSFLVKAGRELKLSVGGLDGGGAPLKGLMKAGATSFDLGKKGKIAVMGMNSKTGLEQFIAASVIGDELPFSFDQKNRIVLTIPASKQDLRFRILRYAGKSVGEMLAFATYVNSEQSESAWKSPDELIKAGGLQWKGELVTKGELGSDDTAYTLDTIELPPKENPWNIWFRTSALAFFPDGRMAVSTHGGDVWIVSGLDREMKKLRWKRFAGGMYEPFGMQVIDGLVYVTCKDRIVRLHDFNDDGEADFYESFSADDDVSTFFHAFNFDLQVDKEGNLYYAKAGQYTSYKLAGAVIKISPDGKKREVYCTGLRTPNGMGMMPDGRPTVSDNQGNWMPASKVSVCNPGGFYGYVQTHSKGSDWAPDGGKIDHTKVVPPKTFDQPIIWMPQNYDNSSGGQLWVEDKRWGPLSGKLLHTSFGKGWLYYMMVQEVDGVEQAGIVKLQLDCDTGIQRARVNPADGQVYAVGLNGWNGNGRKGLTQGGIHRFRYTGNEQKLLTDVKVTKEGLLLSFNFEVSPKAAQDLTRYQIEQWNYLWAANYGSKEYSGGEEWKAGRDKVEVAGVVIGNDGKSVLLKIPGIRPVNQMKLELSLAGGDGEEFSEQLYMTINKVPGSGLPEMKAMTVERAAHWPQPKKKKPAKKAK